MRLIGAGLPRTATLSQKIAIEMLGFGPCYHMVDVLGDLRRAESWRAALEGGGSWDDIFDGYEATVDWPGSFFFEELAARYPEAKVLLSVRDPMKWASSMNETICGVLYNESLMHDLSSARARVDEPWASYIDLMETMWEKSGLIPDGERTSESALAEGMERYNEEVKRTVPADRLLVWSVEEGWEPLCEFLSVPAPAAPFPHVNDHEMFVERIIDSSLAALNAWRSPPSGSE
jgi:hypothetical protein